MAVLVISPMPRHREQHLAGGAVLGNVAELGFELRHPCLHEPDLIEHEAHRTAQDERQAGVLVGQVTRHLRDTGGCSLGHHETELAAKAAQGVDAPGARALPGFTRAVQRLEGLLLDRLDRHRLDVLGTGGFE